uniref:Histidine kinase n=1 Tax=Roseihalotalea indica TaxID=2867963 RepID=A0AA49GGY5_9BACT|nr:histidine kinase [Tunicatimonas sp. TK19036]
MNTEITPISLKIIPSEQKRHMLSWILVWVFMVSGGLEIDWPLWFSIWTQTPYVLLMGLTFYTTYFKGCPWLHKNRTKLILNHLWIGAMFIAIYTIANRVIPEYETFGQPFPEYPIATDVVDALPLMVIIWMAAYGLYYSKYGISLARINSQKAVQLAKKQEQLIRQELKFYKSQFNAHLTFNTLSHIYDKVMDQEEAAESVLLLSDILRYNTAAKADVPVMLDQEITYLQNFIRIHQIIYPQLHIRFLIEGDTHRFKIPPRILVNFVENAIKHGTGNDPNAPITVSLRAHQALEFTVTNKTRTVSHENSTQLGLEITRQTLDAFYGPDHTLTIEQQENRYQVRLVLQPSVEKAWALAS